MEPSGIIGKGKIMLIEIQKFFAMKYKKIGVKFSVSISLDVILKKNVMLPVTEGYLLNYEKSLSSVNSIKTYNRSNFTNSVFSVSGKSSIASFDI